MNKKRPPAIFQFDDRPHVMVIESRFYDDVADKLLEGVKAVLERAGTTYDVHAVPGTLEIPAAISYAVKALNFDAMRRRYDGYVALGCVLKGETQHDEIVAHESAHGLQKLALQHTLAIGTGILTCGTIDQAMERADPARQDRGGAAAEACLRLIELKRHFRLSSKRRWVAR
ncbi:MAG: 6,7-dimethyl-8-ribityllumazine synthase [Alphaproteobacteria bacterium]|nr:6,7-dimethyl-8-ribityllumazine synthase [Alphaproteobacteria bacterium]